MTPPTGARLTMVIEQTWDYPMRMRYSPETRAFVASSRESIAHARGFHQPYGWIKESGTPPEPHWDVILMSEKHYELGEEARIRVIGVFLRADGDHKMIAVEETRDIDELSALPAREKLDLQRLYPRVGAGEGWFGRAVAEKTMTECEKPL